MFVLSKILYEVKPRTNINFDFPYCGESRGVRLRFKEVLVLERSDCPGLGAALARALKLLLVRLIASC